MQQRQQRFLSCFFVLIAGGFLSLSGAVRAQGPVTVTAKFVPRKEAKETKIPDPDKLSDIVRLQISADSAVGVERVTIEVDDQFRLELKKPPYQYDWDTLNENDGLHTLALTAYNTNGQTGVKRLKVTVSNRLKLGVRHWADEALLAFRRGDEVAFTKATRKAYKITTLDIDAIRMMALLVGIQGNVNGGFGMLDNQQNNVPKNDAMTLEVRGFLHLVRGFRQRDVPAMLPDLETGMSLMRQRSLRALQEVKEENTADSDDEDEQIVRGDAFYLVNRRSEALAAYEKATELAKKPKDVRRAKQRVIMTLLRLGRLAEAEKAAVRLIGSAEGTLTSQALLGAIQFHQHKIAAARETVESGVKSKNAAALAVAALCDLATGMREMAYKEAEAAVKAADCAETQYVGMALLGEAGAKEPARKSFELAAINAPLWMPILVERAFQLMAYETHEDRFVQALTIFDVVLGVEPDNAAAIAGRIVAMLEMKRYQGVRAYMVKLTNLEPSAPDLYVLLAAEMNRDSAKARAVTDALTRARTLDPASYKYTSVPLMKDFVAHLMRQRRTMPMTPNLLDRADAPPPPPDTDVKVGVR